MKKKLAICGVSGSGKSTVSEMVNTVLAERGYRVHSIAFAEPLKDFGGRVFGFTHDQLWGPTSSRNAIDERFSGDAALMTWAQVDRRFRAYAPVWLAEILPPGIDKAKALSSLCVWYAETRSQPQITPRYVLQTLGTEWGRALDADIWARSGVVRADRALEKGYETPPMRAIWQCDLVVVSDLRFLNEAQQWTSANGMIWYIDRPDLDESATANAGVAGHKSEQEQKSPEMRQYDTHTIVNNGSLDDLKGKVLNLIKDLLNEDGLRTLG
jgi:energy-coupling factor transporter ATP-binding protein EcfA2